VRGATPPTWKAAAAKALFGAAMLFAFVKLGVLGGEKADTANALLLCAAAAVLYTPVMFATDRFTYQRRLQKEAKK
jgi:quinol-cytochrome oxidoreductase complex cytochrome b subunit